MNEHIKQQGLRAIANLFRDNIAGQFVEVMLGVHQLFSSALDMACALVVNHRLDTKQSKFCGGSDTEVDNKLAQCITAFNSINDKDIFQKCCARMLIHQQSQSIDVEEAMINQLKQPYGFVEFTIKL